MSNYSSKRHLAPRHLEAGESITGCPILIALIELGLSATLSVNSKGVQTKGYVMACSLQIEGGGTQGVVGTDERGDSMPAATLDGEAFEASAINACVQAHSTGNVTNPRGED